MNRHVHLETGESDALGSYERSDTRSVSADETLGPSPGVIAIDASRYPGIPLRPECNWDIREFVVEAALRKFVMDDRPRSRRAAAAVMLRFAERHQLQVFRLGRTRLYRAADFFQALATESESRLDRLLRRAAQ